jgi:hypothetical protein
MASLTLRVLMLPPLEGLVLIGDPFRGFAPAEAESEHADEHGHCALGRSFPEQHARSANSAGEKQRADGI